MWFVCAPAACPFSGRCRGVDAWFKAAPVSGNLQGRYQWLDFSGDSVVQYAQNESPAPMCSHRTGLWSKSLNFNPGTRLSKVTPRSGASCIARHSSRHDYRGVRALHVQNRGVVYGVASGDGGGSLVSSDRIIRPGNIEPLDCRGDPRRGSALREKTPYLKTHSRNTPQGADLLPRSQSEHIGMGRSGGR